MTVIINTKLSEHRGSKRLWLEGKKLDLGGYTPGTRYNIKIARNTMEFSIAENGDYIVSKRERNGRLIPIIDITNQQLAELFEGVEVVRVLIKAGHLVVSAHHHDEQMEERLKRIVSKIQQGKPLDVCSLFHGGGVIDKAMHHGLAHGGVKSRIAVAVEIESDYLDSSLRNNPELWDETSIAIESPVELVDLRKGKLSADVCIGGTPCLGASRSGRSKNKLAHAESHETAGAMFFSFLRFVEALQPGIVIIENVPEYQDTASMAVIRSVLGTLGYVLQERVFAGNEFGALEDRKRLCVVGLTKGLEHLFDINAIQGSGPSGKCINDLLEDVPLDSDRWKSFDYLAAKAERDKSAGKGFARQLLNGSETRCGTIGRGYQKCRSTEPFLVHPTDSSLSRIFTPIEHARLKGIPEEVIRGNSDTTAHEILGQSVIYPMFEEVGKQIGTSLLALLDDLHKAA